MRLIPPQSRDTLRSGDTIGKDYSTPANPAWHNQYHWRWQWAGLNQTRCSAPRDSKESLCWQTATPCPLSPHSPNSGASWILKSLSFYTNQIFIYTNSLFTLSILGCNHPLFLCGFIVNDNGSLGGDILLGLAKLGIGLWFGRTFFVLLEEGGTYSTGF